MDATHVTLADGGFAVVVTGPNVQCPRPYDAHPQLLLMPSADLPDTLPDLLSKFPPNTRMIMIGGELPRPAFGLIKEAAAARRLPWVHRPEATGLTETLKRVLAKTNGTANNPAPSAGPGRKHGVVMAFVLAECDLGKGAAEEARRLMPIAQQRGISTTFASLSQAISVAKRKSGATGVPRSITPAHVNALNTLDEAIAGLQLMRDWIVTVMKENTELRDKHTRAMKVFQDLST